MEHIGTWDQLRLSPSTLMRLVVEGKAKVIGKDRYGRKVYRLVERCELAEEQDGKPAPG